MDRTRLYRGDYVVELGNAALSLHSRETLYILFAKEEGPGHAQDFGSRVVIKTKQNGHGLIPFWPCGFHIPAIPPE